MDKTIEVHNFQMGEVNRVANSRYDVGGKGINVSKVLKEMSVDSLALGFLGGIWEETVKKHLDSKGINHDFISINGETRTNTKVVDYDKNIFTDINEDGPIITSQELSSFTDGFENHCQAGDIVVLSGGAPPGVPKTIYKTLTEIAKKKGAKVVLDADGELLKHGLESRPNIIKPNEKELAKLFGSDELTFKELKDVARRFNQEGIDRVLVSLGSEGSLFARENTLLRGEGLKVKVKSTVGAGDSMVAALVYGEVKGLDNKEALAFAQAAGTAAVTTEGTRACTMEEIQNYLQESLKRIKEMD